MTYILYGTSPLTGRYEVARYTDKEEAQKVLRHFEATKTYPWMSYELIERPQPKAKNK